VEKGCGHYFDALSPSAVSQFSFRKHHNINDHRNKQRFHVEKHRELNIANGDGKPGHLSAASGVVKLGNRVFVVADDEYNLAEFSLDNPNQPGILHRLVPEATQLFRDETVVPRSEFESLIYLEPEFFPPNGALLAIPSGSSPDRYSGVLINLSETGQPITAKEVDFSGLYRTLAYQLKDLNIEGAVCGPNKVYFFQRGNNKASRNAIIELYRDRFIDCLRYFHSVESIAVSSITDCELGDIDGNRLGFTDAAALADGRVVFTAAAEKNGSCSGFAIGLLNGSLEVSRLKKFEKRPKLEGIFAESTTPPLLWMIFDNAQPDQPSTLFTMTME